MRQKIGHIDVRRTLIDFGRCFCSGSIAGGALRDENSIPHAINVRNAFHKFSFCGNNAKDSFIAESRNNSPICIECFSKLNESSTMSEDFIPSVSRLCIALADCCSYRESKGLREVSLATADVISKALDSRTSYFHAF